MAITTIIPDERCPSCKAIVDAHSGASRPDAVPKPGDWTICALCLSLNIFNNDMTQRISTQKEIDTLPSDFKNELCRLFKALKQLNLKDKRGSSV